MPKMSQYNPDSFYANTSVREFYLDFWEGDLNVPDTGKPVEIHSKYHLRPDLMAYDTYGSPNYWWVFALMNKDKLIDPVEDFKAGLTIIVPSKNKIRSLLG
jgi:hypothetical protein|tara:strand:- start:22644 stop:22946 length:303 start_codon:yes stop_codon:yes gene_type:complete